MEEPLKEFLMQVDGMTSKESADAVMTAIRRLDPAADVEVDLAHGHIRVLTRVQSLDVAQAIDRAGFEARAMTL